MWLGQIEPDKPSTLPSILSLHINYKDVSWHIEIKSNQITFLLSHHHSTSALVSENSYERAPDSAEKQQTFTYGQTVQKKQQTIYIWTDSAKKKQQTIYLWTDSAKKNNRQFTYGQTVQKKTTDNLHMDRQCKKTALEHLQCSRQCKKTQQQQFTYGQTVQKKLHWSIYSAPDSAKKHNNSNLHMDRQCKKATAIYIWTVHIYRLYRRQCAKYTYIYSVHIVYYKDIFNYQRHIIHRMGTSALCTVSIHNVVYA